MTELVILATIITLLVLCPVLYFIGWKRQVVGALFVMVSVVFATSFMIHKGEIRPISASESQK